MPPKPSTFPKKGHGNGENDAVSSHKTAHGVAPIPVALPTEGIVRAPNPKLLNKLSFAPCATTNDQVDFPRFLQNCGLLDMITHTFVRLEREKQRPVDPWEWLRYRFFLRIYDPGDKELLRKTLTELTPKKEKLLKERSDLMRAKAKREDAASGVKI
ncbi:hypothetical protein BV898_11714 [Hypsibius exemplaris]|uniref:Uncharacterized protein n=1 Tax=Hypsibius exemplaris TaxID=2072580 RepID=A0A1W0WFT4_HYPEX|nr:hypothetical protein BV898_11714 [Hypsibius exemplaris]